MQKYAVWPQITTKYFKFFDSSGNFPSFDGESFCVPKDRFFLM